MPLDVIHVNGNLLHVGRLIRQQTEVDSDGSTDKKSDEAEDEDVSVVLSDVFSRVFTKKAFSEWVKSMNDGSTPLLVMVGISATAVLSLTCIALLMFVK